MYLCHLLLNLSSGRRPGKIYSLLHVVFSLRRNDKVAHIYPGDVAGKRLSRYSFSNYFDVIGHFDAERVTGY